MLLVFLFLFTISRIESNQEFAFHQFENFVQNAKNCKQESILVEKLKNLRAKLEELKIEISQRKVISMKTSTVRLMAVPLAKFLEDLQSIENVIEIPQEEDIFGAFRGLLFLQDTYQLDPSKW